MGSDPPVSISTFPEDMYQSNTSATPSLRSATKPSSDMDMIAMSLDMLRCVRHLQDVVAHVQLLKLCEVCHRHWSKNGASHLPARR